MEERYATLAGRLEMCWGFANLQFWWEGYRILPAGGGLLSHDCATTSRDFVIGLLMRGSTLGRDSGGFTHATCEPVAI